MFFSLFWSAFAFKTNACKRKDFASGVLKHYDDSTIIHIADRITLNIATNFDIDFRGNYKYNVSDWKENEIEQFNNFKSSDDSCFHNLPEKILQNPTCGNGFVEPGEECDCGLLSECRSVCCDPETCKLRPNVKCTTGKF